MEPILTPHKDALADAGLTLNDLKEPLKGQVQQLETELATNPSNHLKRTKLQNMSGKLAHQIKDFAEAQRPDDAPPATVEAPPVTPPVTPPATTESTPPATTETAPPATTETTPPATTDTTPPATTQAPPATDNGGGRSFFGRHRRV